MGGKPLIPNTDVSPVNEISPIFQPSSVIPNTSTQTSNNFIFPEAPELTELGIPDIAKPTGSFLGAASAGLASTNLASNPAESIASGVSTKGLDMGGAISKGLSGLTDLVAILPGLQDMFKFPEVRTPGRVNLARLQYQDLSDPARRQAIAGRDATQQQVRNMSGGNAAVAMANISQANSQLANQSADIENFEANRQSEIERANQQITNQETMTNFQVAEDTRTINEQNRARAEDLRRSGFRNVGQTLQDLRTRKEQTTRDDALMAENKRANLAKEKLAQKQIEEMKRFQMQQLLAQTAGNTDAQKSLNFDKNGNIIIKDFETGTWKPLRLPNYGK
jgi:hypothetical protein